MSSGIALGGGGAPEAVHTADKDDWIIRGVRGEFYPCKPDIFAESYEPAEAEHLPDIDLSDIPETAEQWFQNAKHIYPPEVRALGLVGIRA